MALIFISISFFVILIYKNTTHLQPRRAIFLLTNGIQYKEIRDFIWRKYELSRPINVKITWSDFETDESEGDQPNILESNLRIEELDDIDKQIRAIEQKVANVEDPLLPIRDMMIEFIKRSDLSSLNESVTTLLSISNNFISQIPTTNDEEWTPEGTLPGNFTQHLMDILQTLIEIADKEGLWSAKKEILNISFPFAIHLFNLGYSREVETIVESFWKKVANDSIRRLTPVFQQIIEYYCSLGELVFDSFENDSNDDTDRSAYEKVKNLADSIFRSVGWLGERLLVKVPLEDVPLMRDHEYINEFSSLRNCLMAFSQIYNHDHPTLYPLIYFDALYVVFRKLTQIRERLEDRKLDEAIFDIADAYSSFAKRAIEANNASGIMQQFFCKIV